LTKFFLLLFGHEKKILLFVNKKKQKNFVSYDVKWQRH